eukprot:53805-Amorphochlora_amoeboformis.AAC.1
MPEKFAHLVIGPAGRWNVNCRSNLLSRANKPPSGKSTYCTALQNHCLTIKRTVHVVNLDPVPICVILARLCTFLRVNHHTGCRSFQIQARSGYKRTHISGR